MNRSWKKWMLAVTSVLCLGLPALAGAHELGPRAGTVEHASVHRSLVAKHSRAQLKHKHRRRLNRARHARLELHRSHRGLYDRR